jgi:hypothetical protein
MSVSDDLTDQLNETARIRDFCYLIVAGQHEGTFERTHYIALALFNRCLQTHEAIQVVLVSSLVDDAWILLRALVEHAVNSVYMLVVADNQTANDFADYGDYLSYQSLLDAKATDEKAFRHHVSIEDEEKQRLRFEAMRSRFDGKRGDKWCVDNALHKRAARIDKIVGEARDEVRSDLLWIVNTVWRHASTYTHGTARSLLAQFGKEDGEVVIQRKYTSEEAVQVLRWSTFALHQAALAVDVALGSENVKELNRMFEEWVARWAGPEGSAPQRTN